MDVNVPKRFDDQVCETLHDLHQAAVLLQAKLVPELFGKYIAYRWDTLEYWIFDTELDARAKADQLVLEYLKEKPTTFIAPMSSMHITGLVGPLRRQ